MRERLLGGQSRLAVGTHALIQEGVDFAKLGLVIIDEQHRFGVLQRQALAKKGQRPHILVMTATPIPRTLTLTLYGDLDVSMLDELPPGRKPIATHWKTQDKRNQVYAAAQRLLNEGRQVYIVCPLVEESEKLQAKSATQLSEHIANRRLSAVPRRPAARADEVGRKRRGHGARSRRTNWIFWSRQRSSKSASTCRTPASSLSRTPTASDWPSCISCAGASGAANTPRFCILMAEPKTEDGRARMEVMTRHAGRLQDRRRGFAPARAGRVLRHAPERACRNCTIADIVRDMDILTETRETAFRLVEADPTLRQPENQPLRRALERAKAGLRT